MKKFLVIGILVVIFGGLTPVIAQQTAQAADNGSEYYYVTVPLEKVYPYRKGYVVAYQKGVNQIVRAYLPLEWFTEAGGGGRGELIYLGPGTTWPYLTVYYKAGEFSHVRMYVRRERGHASWGNIPQNVNIDDRFENVEDLKLEF
ncbi:MAG: hypothetical protein LBL19_03865 [Spirochaetaceae bacterium]|jgi:hypothetical protein|nr:hypothetical protein [Spirochaetaceae bacterium]